VVCACLATGPIFRAFCSVWSFLIDFPILITCDLVFGLRFDCLI
jgi:hypothetical protein